MEAISIKDMSFFYPKTEYPALSNINLSVDEGEAVLVIGESAVGKSTLLKLMKKEIAPAGRISGSIAVNGNVGYVSQNVWESIVSDRVRTELSFGLTNMEMSGEETNLLVAETASYFNLEDKLDDDISTLSGGEVQMLNLAAVMIMRPGILLLDEPTSQLDPVSASRFLQMVQRLHRDFSTTVVMVEHNLDGLIDWCDSMVMVQRSEGVVRLAPPDMIAYLRNAESPLIDLVPAYMRLFDSVFTVSQCRKKLAGMKLETPQLSKQTNDVAIKVRGLSFAYNKGNIVLDNLSIDVWRGEINCVMGPNSSGKSTLLYALSGVRKPYRGKVKTYGTMSMLCQNVQDLFTADCCRDEVAFGDITDLLHISDIENRHPYDLSGGEAQRLALAKVLSTGADILLLDEPTKGFDPVLKKEFGELLLDLCRRGKTILIVSHDVEFVGEFGDTVSFLSGGKIVSTRPRRQFFSNLNFYTTSVARITKGIVQNMACVADLIKAGAVQ